MEKKTAVIGIAVLVVAAVGWFSVTYFEVDAAGEFEAPSVDVNVDGGALPAFEIEQTKETELPDVDVDTDSGNIPEFEVKGPDVEVGSKKVNVPTPDIDVKMEETEVEVPAIGIEAPGEEEDVVNE